MKILLGLGNPGKKYRNNRHNIGFMVIDAVASDLNVAFRRKSALLSTVAQASVSRQDVILAKSLTYMNNSGAAFERLCSFYKLLPDEVLVIYDDADLELGVLRFAKSGSAGGHRGMSSLIEAAATQQLKRLRIGIGSPAESDLSEYVLSDFDCEEMPQVKNVIEQSRHACVEWVRNGIEAVMQKYNGKQIGGKESGEKL